jgi:hypothetical protein
MDGYIVAGVVAVIALAMFYKPIARLIDRISGASKDGITFERPQEVGEVKSALLSFTDLMKEPVSASILEREKTIQNQLQAFNLKNEEEKISVLSRALATARVALEFNNIANIIFGSQVTLLIQLSGTHNGITQNQAEIIFEQAKTAFPELHGERKLEDWLMYLHSSNLITLTENKIDITQFGTDFLKHLVDSRMAYNRYG